MAVVFAVMGVLIAGLGFYGLLHPRVRRLELELPDVIPDLLPEQLPEEDVALEVEAAATD